MVSVAIITKDEAARIEKCIRRIRSCSVEIVVLDTGSKDATVELATPLADTVVRSKLFTDKTKWQDFDFSAARNEAMEHCKGSWVLSVDADELLDRISIPMSGDVANAWVDIGDVKFLAPRWVRRASPARWINRCHEMPRPAGKIGNTRTLLTHTRPAARKDNLARNRVLLVRQMDEIWADPSTETEVRFKTLIDLGNNLFDGGVIPESLGYFYAATHLTTKGAYAYGMAHERVAAVLGRLCMVGAAEEHLRRAIASEFGNRSTQMMLVDILMNLGRYDEAQELCRAALEDGPGPDRRFAIGDDASEEQVRWLEENRRSAQSQASLTKPELD